MIRQRVESRRDWQSRCESVGFYFHSLDGRYWDESVCYKFSASEIDQVEAAANAVHMLCLEAVDHVITRGRFDEFSIDEKFVGYVEQSWKRREPSLFGRFDFCWDGKQAPKLLEYNADTPTSLIEASIAQWYWLKDVFPQHDQFNSIHEALIARWQSMRAKLPVAATLHFACVEHNLEDRGNLDGSSSISL